MADTPRKPRTAATKKSRSGARAAASTAGAGPRRRGAAGPTPVRNAAAKRASASISAPKGRTAATPKPRPKPKPGTKAKPAAKSRALTEAERDRQFSLLLHTSCLKAGTAAVVTTLSTRVPLLNRIAPMLVGSMMQSLAVPRIQQQLVTDVLDLYGLELSELERQGVVLLATAANVGAQELSRRTVEELVNRVGAPLGRPILDRMLPVTNLVAENAAAIASTYAVGRRAQALCRLSGTGARDLGELLGAITGIDQRRLVDWSTEAVKLALRPFRAALLTLRPLA